MSASKFETRASVLFVRKAKRFSQAFLELGDLTAIGSLSSREEVCIFLFRLRERRLFNEKGDLPQNQVFFAENADLRSKTMIFLVINAVFLT
ncbi:MAG: hypothetical protein WCO29_09150 [Nostocales cyanobacterium ELA583]